LNTSLLSFNDPQALVQGRKNMDLLNFKTSVFLFMSYSEVDEIAVPLPKLSGKFKIIVPPSGI
jgi:hypothetical protein